MSKIRINQKAKEKRVVAARDGTIPRVPFSGFRQKLQLSDADTKEFDRRGMVARWFNDESGRLARALGAGYTFVKPEDAPSLGNGAIFRDNSEVESQARVSVVVSKGEPIIRAYLMEISKKFYKEDQAAKELVNQKVDEALRQGGAGGASIENQYGPGVTYSR